jgi:uncharacterized protein YihD (DUF1040 family)
MKREEKINEIISKFTEIWMDNKDLTFFQILENLNLISNPPMIKDETVDKVLLTKRKSFKKKDSQKIIDFLDKYKIICGLDKYDILLSLIGKVGKTNLAEILPEEFIRKLKIVLGEDFYNLKEEEQKEVLIHELYHGRYNLFGDMLNRAKDKKSREEIEELYINDLSYGFCKYLE